MHKFIYFNENYRKLAIARSAKNQNRSKVIDLPTIYCSELKRWRIEDNYER
jgi:hypothetical protein